MAQQVPFGPFGCVVQNDKNEQQWENDKIVNMLIMLTILKGVTGGGRKEWTGREGKRRKVEKWPF